MTYLSRPHVLGAGVRLSLVSGMALTIAGVPAAAAPLSIHDAAIAFGMREGVSQASLSPDGTKLATVEPLGARGTVLRVLDLADPASQPMDVLTSSGDPERINWCRWAGTKRLMCMIYALTQVLDANLVPVTRLVAVDTDAKNLQMLKAPGRSGQSWGYNLYGGSIIDWNPGKDGHVYVMRQYQPSFTTGQHVVRSQQGLAVDDIDSANLKSTTVETPRNAAVDYVSDGQGKVRLIGYDDGGSGYASNAIRYVYRPKAGSDWLPLGKFDRVQQEGFNPLFVDPTLDLAYGLKKIDGRLSAVSIALDGSNKETLLFARPDVDVTGFATVGRNSRVIGATYTTDRGEAEYFDPGFKRLATSLSKALPNTPLIRFVDASQDEKKLLLWSGSDVDPGRYLLLDRASNAMTELALTRGVLDGVPLAKVRSVSIPTTDGAMIPAYLTLPPGSDGKNLPTIVLPHGGPSSRDEWGFDWLAQFWASIGYAVLQPNYRGSAGYGDVWFQRNGFQSWRTAIGDVAESGRWLVKQGIADPKKMALMGWSYGGYASLQTAAIEPDLFRAVVAVAPVTDLGRFKEEFRQFTNFYMTSDFVGSGPHVEEGSPARQAAKIKAPVMLFHGTYDRNVAYQESQLMDERLRAAGKSSKLVVFDKLDHQLDDSSARQAMLEQSANFLQQAFAAPK